MGRLSRVLAGMLLALLGVAKSLGPGELHSHFERTLHVGHSTSVALVWLVVALEVGVGAALIFGRSRVAPTIASVGAASLLLYLVLSGDTDGSSCGCFGTLAQATWGRRVVVAGALLFLASRSLDSSESPLMDATRSRDGGATA